MSRNLYILAHAAMAAIFIFALQHFVLKQSLETAGLWAVVFCAAAAALAWNQSKR